MDEKLVSNMLQAEAFKVMASLFTDIRKLRRLTGDIVGSPLAQKKILIILNEMEKKLAP